MEATSLHGVKYIAEDGRHWTERLLWTFLVLLGSDSIAFPQQQQYHNNLRFIITFIFIWPIWRKYLDSPTLTTIGSTNYPIWEVGILQHDGENSNILSGIVRKAKRCMCKYKTRIYLCLSILV